MECLFIKYSSNTGVLWCRATCNCSLTVKVFETSLSVSLACAIGGLSSCFYRPVLYWSPYSHIQKDKSRSSVKITLNTTWFSAFSQWAGVWTPVPGPPCILATTIVVTIKQKQFLSLNLSFDIEKKIAGKIEKKIAGKFNPDIFDHWEHWTHSQNWKQL